MIICHPRTSISLSQPGKGISSNSMMSGGIQEFPVKTKASPSSEKQLNNELFHFKNLTLMNQHNYNIKTFHGKNTAKVKFFRNIYL